MSYCDLASLKMYLGIAAENEEDDTLLAALLVRATAIIDATTQRRFAADEDTTRRFDARRDVSGPLLWLRDDLAAVTVVINGDGAVVPAPAYIGEPRQGGPYYGLRLRSGSGLQWTYNNEPEEAIQVTGRWAYSVTPPANIVQAAARLAAYLYRQKDNAQDLDRTTVVGAAAILPTDLPRDVRLLLAPYKRRL